MGQGRGGGGGGGGGAFVSLLVSYSQGTTFMLCQALSFLSLFFFFREAESVMVENLKLHDGQEGIKAFIQKRKPSWTHTTDCR